MKQLDVLEHTFDKAITCPVCSNKFEIKWLCFNKLLKFD